MNLWTVVIPIVIVVALVAAGVRIVNQYENGISSASGASPARARRAEPHHPDHRPDGDRRHAHRGPRRPAQDVITKDNVSVKVNAVIYFRVMQAGEGHHPGRGLPYATSQLAQTTLRSILGQQELDDLLASARRSTSTCRRCSTCTRPWGIKISNVEVKDVDLPVEMRRAMARRPSRARPARQGHRRRGRVPAPRSWRRPPRSWAAARPRSAALPADAPGDRRDKNSTTIFPLPIDLISSWLKGREAK
jgi:regulator of protease activity HflC (stomatin/prohibitin superfamily)